jgi:hypothetical protein
VVDFEPAVLSVLDNADIRTSRQVGTAAAFDRRIRGRSLRFRRKRGRLFALAAFYPRARMVR